MIQVNLVPDLKKEFLKAQRTKRLVITMSFLIAAGFVAVTVILFMYVSVAQKQHTDNLAEDVDKLVSEFQSKSDVDKIVTIQKQLSALPGLHQSKPLISRTPQIFGVITPDEVVKFQSLDINFDTTTVSITAKADSVAEANRFVNSIKNARYTVGEDKENEIKPFSNVILSNLGSNEEGTSFEVSFVFDSQIFLNHDEVTLFVPEINSTLSEVESPNLDAPTNEDVFNEEEDE